MSRRLSCTGACDRSNDWSRLARNNNRRRSAAWREVARVGAITQPLHSTLRSVACSIDAKPAAIINEVVGVGAAGASTPFGLRRILVWKREVLCSSHCPDDHQVN